MASHTLQASLLNVVGGGSAQLRKARCHSTLSSTMCARFLGNVVNMETCLLRQSLANPGKQR